MILRRKKDGKFYNLVGIENNGIEITLKLSYWYQTDKDAFKKSGRSVSVFGWESLIEQMQKFEEIGPGEITAYNVRDWMNNILAE